MGNRTFFLVLAIAFAACGTLRPLENSRSVHYNFNLVCSERNAEYKNLHPGVYWEEILRAYIMRLGHVPANHWGMPYDSGDRFSGSFTSVGGVAFKYYGVYRHVEEGCYNFEITELSMSQ